MRLVRDYQLQLYYLDEGSTQPALVQGFAQALMVAIAIRDAQAHTGDDHYEAMVEAMTLLQRCAEDGFRWKQVYSLTIDDGMTCALGVMRYAKATELHAAWQKVTAVDQGLPRR